MKIVHTQTRWYFSAGINGDRYDGYVDFSIKMNRKKQANVWINERGTHKLKFTGPVQRRDKKNATLAFKVWAESI